MYVLQFFYMEIVTWLTGLWYNDFYMRLRKGFTYERTDNQYK